MMTRIETPTSSYGSSSGERQRKKIIILANSETDQPNVVLAVVYELLVLQKFEIHISFKSWRLVSTSLMSRSKSMSYLHYSTLSKALQQQNLSSVRTNSSGLINMASRERYKPIGLHFQP